MAAAGHHSGGRSRRTQRDVCLPPRGSLPEAAGPAAARAEEETFNKDKVFQHVRDDWGIFVHVAHSANAGAPADADRFVGAAVAVDKIPNEALRKRIRAYAADVSKKPMAPTGMAG